MQLQQQQQQQSQGAATSALLFKSVSYLTGASKNKAKLVQPRSALTDTESKPERQVFMVDPVPRSIGAIPTPNAGPKQAVAPQQQPSFDQRTYKILIREDRFEPAVLKIEKGSIVEWRVSGCSSEHQLGHVIAFEQNPLLSATESPRLQTGEVFKVRFLESGSYPYKCQIVPRMRGSLQVFEDVHQLIKSNMSHRTVTLVKQAVFSMGEPAKPPLEGAAEGQKATMKRQLSQNELSQRLIEVLEEEKGEETTPFINKNYVTNIIH